MHSVQICTNHVIADCSFLNHHGSADLPRIIADPYDVYVSDLALMISTGLGSNLSAGFCSRNSLNCANNFVLWRVDRELMV